MSELQDALDRLTTELTQGWQEDDVRTVVKAARKWATLQSLVENGEAGRIIVRAGREAQNPKTYLPHWYWT